MDTLPSACQLTCSGYADIGSSCSQIGPGGYGRYPNAGPNGMPMRGNPIGQPNGASMLGAANRMNARSHADHMQTSMFQTGIGLQSKYSWP